MVLRAVFSSVHADALFLNAHLCFLVGFLDLLEQTLERLDFVAVAAGQFVHQFISCLLELVDAETDTKAELGAVFEQRVVPGRSTAISTLCIGSGGQVAAVDGGTTGGVADHKTVTEQLGEQFQVRCFATARASAGVFEQRTDQLAAAQGVQLEQVDVHFRQVAGRSRSWLLQ